MRVSPQSLFLGFNTIFNKAFAGVPSTYGKFAMTVPSRTSVQGYAALAALPGMREWIGDRVIHQLGEHDYTVKNKAYELTIKVLKNDVDDDNIGLYPAMFENLGYEAAVLPDVLCYQALMEGFTKKCYDGQYFFDTDHPVFDTADTTFSNYQTGSGAAWFLMDTTRPLKPIVFQDRQRSKLTRKDSDTDDNVFMRGDLVYGVDARCAAGYGLPHMCFASKAALSFDNYRAARLAIQQMKSASGSPLGLTPNLLVVPPTLEADAKLILEALELPGAGTNTWYKTAELLVASRL